MSKNSWKNGANCAINRNGPSGFGEPISTLEHSEPDKEVRSMSLWVHIGDSRQHFKTERSVNGGDL